MTDDELKEKLRLDAEYEAWFQALPLDELPNNDSGSIERRRRGFEAAMKTFGKYTDPDDSDTWTVRLEAFEIALEEAKNPYDAEHIH